MKKQKLGDWPIEVQVLGKDVASTYIHDPVPIPTKTQEKEHKQQVARDKSHPAYGLRNKD